MGKDLRGQAVMVTSTLTGTITLWLANSEHNSQITYGIYQCYKLTSNTMASRLSITLSRGATLSVLDSIYRLVIPLVKLHVTGHAVV